MSLLSVEEALAAVLVGVPGPVEVETVPLGAGDGRTLACDLAARRTQPPFPASAMDGYAVRASDVVDVPAVLRVIGASLAGRRFAGRVGPGEAVRIFTGAPVPDGADAIVIQENTDQGSGTASGRDVTIRDGAPVGRFVRPAGLDFKEGEVLLQAGLRMTPNRLALAAAMGHPSLPVRRRPRIAVLATGDELARPGDALEPDQIVASNPYAVAALIERSGGEPIDLGIAPDDVATIARRAAEAQAAGADMLLTLGGVSVGEHDLTRTALGSLGMTLGFWRIAMRPGKPLMHGRLGRMIVLGLPGNPVSSIVCAMLFVEPAIRALLGDPQAGVDRSEAAVLGASVPVNDGRQDYVRARLTLDADGHPVATPFPRQDSSMLGVLSQAGALILRAPHAPEGQRGEACRILRMADAR